MSRRLTGAAGLGGGTGTGGAVNAIGPDGAACSTGAGDADLTWLGVGSAQPQSAIKAITLIVRFNVITLMLGPLAEYVSIEPGSYGRFLVVCCDALEQMSH